MTPSSAPIVQLSGQARDALRASARGATRREGGGILIGYRTAEGLFVEDALTVVDKSATHSGYLRRGQEAQYVLDECMRLQTSSSMGYVGEWHTHPLPCPPSARDQASMRLIAVRNSQPTGLVVAALGDNQKDVSFYALLSKPSSVRGRWFGRYVESAVVFDCPTAP